MIPCIFKAKMVQFGIVKEYPLIVLIRTYPNTRKGGLPNRLFAFSFKITGANLK